MISRVAESCFWLHRQVERVENTARMLQVNVAFLLDADLAVFDQWRPLVSAAGEEGRFAELVGGAEAMEDGEAVQEYLVWDERCPASVLSAVREARETARTVRDTISGEMWTALNEFWLWLRGGVGRRQYHRDRPSFYERVKDSCHLFHGVTNDTMLHDDAFGFMRLGMLLERAGWTARVLDVTHHGAGGRRRGRVEEPDEVVQWLAVLRSCSGATPFFRRSSRSLTGQAVAEFLLFEPAFPRSVSHCVTRAAHFLERVRPADRFDIGRASGEQLNAVVQRMQEGTIETVLAHGLHQTLSEIVEQVAEVCDAVREDYFEVTVHALQPAE